MSVFDHARTADRILHTINPDGLSAVERIRLAAAHAALAAADEANLRTLVALLAHADELHPLARGILLARIRRRTGILPPDTLDGVNENGGA